MKKFEISEHMSKALDKQRSTLLVTTAASAVGYAFVFGVQLLTQVAGGEEVLEMPETPGVDFTGAEDK
jgi:hypothetical protein